MCNFSHNRRKRVSLQRNEKGFSLIEVMVVMAVIGIMTVAAVTLIPSGDAEDMVAARKTAALFEQIHREAVITGQTVGVSLSDGQLDVRTLGHEGWQSKKIAGLDALAPFLKGARLEVYDTVFPQTNDRKREEEDTERYMPSIWFLPTGQYLKFSIRHADTAKQYVVVGEVGKPVTFMPAGSQR